MMSLSDDCLSCFEHAKKGKNVATDMLSPRLSQFPRDAQRAVSERAINKWKRLLKETEVLDPHKPVQREDDASLKSSLCLLAPPVLLDCEKSGNASDSNAHTWRSPPSIACEPIAPTPTMMRTNCARRTRWRRQVFRHWSKRK